MIVKGGNAAAAMRGSQLDASSTDAMEGWKGPSATLSASEELEDVVIGNRDNASATVLFSPLT